MRVYANAMCMSDGWSQTQIECIFKSNVLVECVSISCVCVQLERLTKSMLTATFVFTPPPHTHALANVQGTSRYSTVQQGTARYSNVQQGTARYSTVQQGTARHSTVRHHTLPHITICRRAAGQHIQLSCVELMTIMSPSPGPEWLIKVLSLSVRPTASRERTPRYNTRNISAHHGTARHSTCSVAVIGMEYAGLVDVTVEGSASSCAYK